jgi:hypothetical protein
MSFSAKSRPGDLYRTCEEKHRENYRSRPKHSWSHPIYATTAFKITMGSITFEDNLGRCHGRSRGSGFLQHFLRVCEARFSPKKIS